MSLVWRSVEEEADWEGLWPTGGPPKGQLQPNSSSASVTQWTLFPELVLKMKSDVLEVGKDGKVSRGGGGHLGTYQRSHPLEEVDALPVIDVVGLPTLPGIPEKGQSGTCLPDSTFRRLPAATLGPDLGNSLSVQD